MARTQVTIHGPADVVAERISPAVGTVERIDDRSCVLHTCAAEDNTVYSTGYVECR
jgi:hypothetical protein